MGPPALLPGPGSASSRRAVAARLPPERPGSRRCAVPVRGPRRRRWGRSRCGFAQDRRARAAMLIDRHRLADEATSAPALAVAALTWAHAGRVDAAKEAMRGASQLLARLDGYATWRGVEARILLARCASRLTEVS